AQLVKYARRGTAPDALWLAAPFLVLFLAVQVGVKAWIDPLKRLDDLTAAIRAALPGSGPVPAYVPPQASPESLFGIVGFQSGRRPLRFAPPDALARYCAATPAARVVLQVEAAQRLPADLRGKLRLVYDESGRKASPYAIADCAPTAAERPRTAG